MQLAQVMTYTSDGYVRVKFARGVTDEPCRRIFMRRMAALSPTWQGKRIGQPSTAQWRTPCNKLAFPHKT